MNLRVVNLHVVNLRVVNLHVVNLRVVNLRVVNLRVVNLRVVNPRVVNLRVVNLRVVNLRALNLRASTLRALNSRASTLVLRYETHATSLDNEAGLASGHYDVALSPLGERQAAAMGERYRDDLPALVLTSDLQRAWRTAAIAFGDRVPIVRDARLRECDYGELTRKPAREIDRLRMAAIDAPFPGGESYAQATARVAACLDDLRKAWPGGWVLLIGHRATHYALDHLLDGLPLAEAMSVPFRWQPGWTYRLPAWPEVRSEK